jgi:hypothetical protein
LVFLVVMALALYHQSVYVDVGPPQPAGEPLLALADRCRHCLSGGVVVTRIVAC